MPKGGYKKPLESKSRNWCFTLNNYTDRDYEVASCMDKEKMKFLVVGKEVGDQGTPHLQGYVVWTSPRALTFCKNWLKKAHFEIARGSYEENQDYCSKGGDFVIYGERPMSQEEKGKAGKRKWEEAKKLAIEGNFQDIDASIYISQYTNLKRIHHDHIPKPNSIPSTAGIWVYGLSGTGKSRMIWEKYPNAYRKMMNKWWDGYSMEKIVVLEDVDKENGKWLGFYLKIWMDHYPFRAEVKNSSLMIRPEKIIVTSQYQIHEIWQDDETRDAITRRCVIINKNNNETID